MAIYEVETEDGIYEVEVADDENKDSTLPNLERTEDKIAGREDLLGSLMSRVKQNPLKEGSNPLNSFGLVGGLAQRGEAAVSSPLLELQKGKPEDTVASFIDGISGNRQTQLGDLIRTTGVGGEYNDAIASTTGFLAALGVDNLTGKVASSKLSSIIGNVKDPIVKSVNDSIVNKTGFLDDVRRAFYEAKSRAVEKYGAGLEKLAMDNPDKSVSIRPVVEDIAHQISNEPKLRNAINRVPGLAGLVEDPKLADKLPLKTVQDLVNDLQSKISQSKLGGGKGIRPDDLPLLDAIHDIKAQMLEAFPDIKKLRKDYGDLINNFNLVRNKLKHGSLQKAVRENFGDVEVQSAAKELLKESPDILSRIQNYNNVRKVGKVLAGLIGATGLGYATKKGFDLAK